MTNPSTIIGRLRMGGRLMPVSVAAVLAIAAACGTKDAAGPLQPSGPVGRVRFVNVITDTTRGRVNAILESVPLGVNITHGVAVPASLAAPSNGFYAPIYAGSRTLVLKRTIDTSVTVATINFTVTANQDQTIFATGGAGATAVTPLITTDDNPVVAATEVRWRAVNMTTGTVDVFFTASGADLTTATANVTGLAPQTASAYFTLTPGSYQIRVVPTGTAAGARNANAIINVPAATYVGGTARTFLAATAANGGTPLKGVVLGDR